MTKKSISKLTLIAMIFLMLSGCENSGGEQLRVYSFKGENENFFVSNGVIVLNKKDDIFAGGELNIENDLLSNIKSFKATFYTLSDEGKEIILSMGVEDMTGGTIVFPSDLGKISRDKIIKCSKNDDYSDLENNLYLDLSVVNTEGETNNEQIKMSLSEITKD